MSMFTLLGIVPNESIPSGLSDAWAIVGKFLEDTYIKNSKETERRAHIQELDDLYEGKGNALIVALLNDVCEDAETKKLRTKFVAWSKYNNLIARIVGETATVYSEPAARKIANDDERYQAFLSLARPDDAMREVNRKLVLVEDVLIMYRVRTTPRGRRPVIEVISPASFWAIAHPKDRTLLVGVILDQRVPNAKEDAPAYRVWLDDETFMLDSKCRVIIGTREDWPLGRFPGVLGSTRQPGTKPTILAECPSADLKAAHIAVWFQNLLGLKESKSANRQTYVTGDTTAATMGQSADTEREVMLPEGVQVQALDRGMDQSMFRDNAMFISDTTGSNHGVPPSVMQQKDASSGAEIHLRRIPLRELRRVQIPVMRAIELELAEVMALVNSARPGMMPDEHGNPVAAILPGDLQDYAFSAEGFSIDFGEIQQPLTEVEADQVYDERNRLGLTSLVAEYRKRNPDIKTDEEALGAIKAIQDQQLKVFEMRQPLAAMNGSTNTPIGANTPQQNGAMGPKAVAEAAAADAAPKPPIGGGG